VCEHDFADDGQACVNRFAHNLIGSWLSQSYMELGSDDSSSLKASHLAAQSLSRAPVYFLHRITEGIHGAVHE
jgi:hypothetical protein